jgi:hypothetical protein
MGDKSALDLAMASRLAWRREAERLRQGIQDYLDGNYKSARSYRPGKCPHGLWYFNECENCNDEYFHSLLDAPKDVPDANR